MPQHRAPKRTSKRPGKSKHGRKPASAIYDLRLLEIELEDERRAIWEWQGSRISGDELIYAVKDRNFPRLNRWTFVVRVPKSRRGQIVVQPRRVPAKSVWAGLERRSIVFQRATKNPYRVFAYCKVALADPAGVRNRIYVRASQGSRLPKWFRSFKPKMAPKDVLTTTRGTDAKHLALAVRPENHSRMIQLFFASKVWVLEEGFTLDGD